MSNSEVPQEGHADGIQMPLRPFIEPEVSSPVDVVEGNPAADAFFAVITSGGT